ncbi:hypothetical protein GGR57DRAFT_114382 [Xylariaceae sp. FL1272]|nr:hypothetical protein GGR57DRAFT_114382 [Xylariaceae sp. FL1272]
MTSADDYIKWVKALMNHEDPIIDEVYRDLVKIRSFPDPDGTVCGPFCSLIFYAAGPELSWYRGYEVTGQDGCSLYGFQNRHLFMSDLELGCVIFGNANGDNETTKILAHEMIDEAIGVPVVQRPNGRQIVEDEVEQNEYHTKEEERKIRQEFGRSDGEQKPQKMPLEAYVGKYWDPGYQGLAVEIQEWETLRRRDGSRSGFYFNLYPCV